MGSVLGTCRPYFNQREFRIMMVGLDLTGKTTILYKLKLGENITTLPTVGFNVENIDYNGYRFCIWDVGGQYKVRQHWSTYFHNTDAIIFVVDSSDRDRIPEANEELQKMLKFDVLKDIPFLIFANKQDLPNIMSTDEISAKLNLESINDREWNIQGTSAITSEGINRGLEWLISVL